MNIENLRYRGRHVFWRDGYLFAAILDELGQQLAEEGRGQWRAFRSHDDCDEVGRGGEAGGESEPARAAALRCLVDAGVLTVEPAAAVMSAAPASAPMKFLRLAAPLQPTEYDILRAAGVEVIYGGASVYTVDMPAAKADAIVALLSALNINAKSYEV